MLFFPYGSGSFIRLIVGVISLINNGYLELEMINLSPTARGYLALVQSPLICPRTENKKI